MAREQDPRVTTFIEESLPRLRRTFRSLRAVIFGSRGRRDARSTSDLDVILVSPTFRSISFLKRPVAVLEALDYPAGLELLCYTPEEFAAKRDEFGVVRVALEEDLGRLRRSTRTGSASLGFIELGIREANEAAAA